MVITFSMSALFHYRTVLHISRCFVQSVVEMLSSSAQAPLWMAVLSSTIRVLQSSVQSLNKKAWFSIVVTGIKKVHQDRYRFLSGVMNILHRWGSLCFTLPSHNPHVRMATLTIAIIQSGYWPNELITISLTEHSNTSNVLYILHIPVFPNLLIATLWKSQNI